MVPCIGLATNGHSAANVGLDVEERRRRVLLSWQPQRLQSGLRLIRQLHDCSQGRYFGSVCNSAADVYVRHESSVLFCGDVYSPGLMSDKHPVQLLACIPPSTAFH